MFKQCVGGCTGPTARDCLACRKFNDEGQCKEECPSFFVFMMKFSYGATCVTECPDYFLRQNGKCVDQCQPNMMSEDGECVPCKGDCPKKCKSSGIIHPGNINDFKDCVIIEGPVDILDQSFNGVANMPPSSLEVFSNVKEITGYLNVQATHPAFKSLYYFRNLEVISGRQLMEDTKASIFISGVRQALDFV